MLPTRFVTRGRRNPGYLALPERLRKARKAAGLSASALSLQAGVSRRAAGQVETGQWVPRLATVELLADALKVSPAYLAFGVEVSWEARAGKELRCAGFAERVRSTRETRGLSMREVGRRIESAASTVQSIERGTMPAVDTVEKLAKALDVTPSWLAYGIGERGGLPVRSRQSRPAPLG